MLSVRLNTNEVSLRNELADIIRLFLVMYPSLTSKAR